MNTTVPLLILIAAGIAGVYGKNILCFALVLIGIFGPMVYRFYQTKDVVSLGYEVLAALGICFIALLVAKDFMKIADNIENQS